LVSMVLVLSGCDLLEEAKDKVKDAVDDAVSDNTPGVKGVIKDSAGDKLEGAIVTVIGFTKVADLEAVKDAFDTKTKKLKVEEFVTAVKDNDGTFDKITTKEDGEYASDLKSPAYLIFVEGPDGSYKTAFGGIPQDKKVTTIIDDFTKMIGDFKITDPGALTPPDWAIIFALKKKTRNFTLAGGPAPADIPADGTSSGGNGEEVVVAAAPAVEPAAVPAPAAVTASKFNVQPTTEPVKVPAAADTEKNFYPFSFAFVSTSSGAAYGEYDRSGCGQPIPVNTNLTYKWSGGWVPDTGTTAKPRKTKDNVDVDGAVVERMLVLTGYIDAYKAVTGESAAKYLVFEVMAPGETTYSRHFHFIGFDENGIYETRTIYLAEGWKTRLSMCESIANGAPVNQSFTVTFDDSANAANPAPFVAVMSYNKGYAVEAAKGCNSNPDVIDLDFAVTDRSANEVIAWYSSEVTGSGLLTYDTWFGYGPEMIIAEPGSAWSTGFTLYTEPYSIGDTWTAAGDAGIVVNISIDTIKGYHKDFSTTFNANGDSFTAGSFDISGNPVRR